jgi:Cu(I)/Ag(I) efflux system membrane fusion protein
MKSKYLLTIGLLLFLIGLLATACHQDNSASASNSDVDYYTCTMHPSVRLHDPKDKCPICGMSTVPVMKKKTGAETNQAAAAGPSEFFVPLARQQQIGVTYATVEKKPLQSTLRAVGTISVDKLRRWNFVSRVDGYVQKLDVSSPGELVESNQPLLTIYSPDLLTAQREFIELLQMRDAAEKSNSPAARQSAENLLASTRRRLALWNITPEQIATLERTRQASETLSFHSPFKGIVQSLPVDQGRKVAAGDQIVDVADLSVVWAWAQFYQDELPLLKKDLPVVVTTGSGSEEKFAGKIAIIDPFIDESTRTARVRVDIENPDFKLRPGMYVNILLKCDSGEGLAVPVSAVLPTGKGNIVFLDQGAGKLLPRFVELGRKFGDEYAVVSGLNEGERVVNSANFLIDAESRIQGALKTW